MGLAETIEKHKTAATVCSVLAIALGVAYAVYKTNATAFPNTAQAFYTVDDGKTWFVDDSNRLSPFDHDGKTAVRMYLWRSHGKTFVSYLERRTDEANRKIAALRKAGPVDTTVIGDIDRTALQIKKPGEDVWHFESDPAFARIVRPSGPDGSTDDLEPVYP